MRERGAGEPDRRDEVEQEQVVEGVVVELGHRAEGDHPGRVDEPVQRSDPDDLVDDPARPVRRRQVGGHRRDDGAVTARTREVAGEQAQAFGVAARQAEPGPGRGEAAAERRAEATGGAEHEDMGSVEGGHRSILTRRARSCRVRPHSAGPPTGASPGGWVGPNRSGRAANRLTMSATNVTR